MSVHSRLSFCDCASYGEIGGEAYASRFDEAAAWKDARRSSMEDLEASDLNEEKGESAIEGPIDELKDSERFISGGERSEETVRRLLWGVLYVRFAIACVAGCLLDGVKGGAGFGDLQGPIHDAWFVDGEQRWSKEWRRAHKWRGR
jgi:hypothetical protein